MMVRPAIASTFGDDLPGRRQLRLIDASPEDVPASLAPPESPGEPAATGEQTLAAYLWDLGVGSPCFSCGEDLVGADDGLVCPVCGAAVQREAA